MQFRIYLVTFHYIRHLIIYGAHHQYGKRAEIISWNFSLMQIKKKSSWNVYYFSSNNVEYYLLHIILKYKISILTNDKSNTWCCLTYKSKYAVHECKYFCKNVIWSKCCCVVTLYFVRKKCHIWIKAIRRRNGP